MEGTGVKLREVRKTRLRGVNVVELMQIIDGAHQAALYILPQ